MLGIFIERDLDLPWIEFMKGGNGDLHLVSFRCGRIWLDGLMGGGVRKVQQIWM